MTPGRTADARFLALGLAATPAGRPVASYVPVVVSGGFAFVSGHGPLGPDGAPACQGAVGDGVSLDEARAAAQLTVGNLLRSLRTAVGSLDAVAQVCSLRAFVYAIQGSGASEQVADASSGHVMEIFGDPIGRHARSAVAVNGCVFGLTVTIEGVFALHDPTAATEGTT